MTPITPAASIVAHQGGWDEILLVGGPIVLIIGVLAIAKKRVDRLHGADAAPESSTDEPTSA